MEIEFNIAKRIHAHEWFAVQRCFFSQNTRGPGTSREVRGFSELTHLFLTFDYLRLDKKGAEGPFEVKRNCDADFVVRKALINKVEKESKRTYKHGRLQVVIYFVCG